MSGDEEPWDAGEVRGAGVVAALCARCLVVLLAVNVVLAPAAVVLLGEPGEDGVPFAVLVAALAVAVAVVPVAVVGWPAGLLLAHLLRGRSREGEHVAAFALVGAVLAPAVLVLGSSVPPGPWGTGTCVLAAAEGAVGAGVARWWTGRARRRRWNAAARADGTVAALSGATPVRRTGPGNAPVGKDGRRD
ncbi:hypothetical protein [Cellulomonas fimi]|uniref:Uncharacterized protein n=1 Tax=Cellulomonas fimi (strain ATCC 484 / DSM 20113 / JCM 1341 / CCUG 24087 / LMG 16345 / NBRC 15513 / NCIMB 8980 / NCTC 7547 / NRS-133) TaxID=590998 RepID=F4H7F6_CELFA|nr:hypothetical protein [Cellulomonas fimi]AEE46917.1 hypothetical protein Celf_2793 [Cellulomonas fimi ATCC 484]NNH07864.1 hypothetical protein [Cellulomonas fimi]VEH34558.1 Uncharacterised protein [Cellulomonas fimi]